MTSNLIGSNHPLPATRKQLLRDLRWWATATQDATGYDAPDTARTSDDLTFIERCQLKLHAGCMRHCFA